MTYANVGDFETKDFEKKDFETKDFETRDFGTKDGEEIPVLLGVTPSRVRIRGNSPVPCCT